MSKGKRLRNQRTTAPPPPVGKKRPADRRLWRGGAAVAVLVAVGIAVAAIGSGGGGAKPVHVNFGAMSGLQNGAPPWNNGVGELQQRLGDVHLDPLAQEALAFHIHQHVDIFVNGKHVTVPALIGIDDSSFITEMHTHDASGVVHVESPTRDVFTLGQFFDVWGVRLTQSCLGGECGGGSAGVRVYVDGHLAHGDPRTIELVSHQQIAVVFGPERRSEIPSSYTFGFGL